MARGVMGNPVLLLVVSPGAVSLCGTPLTMADIAFTLEVFSCVTDRLELRVLA